MPCLYTEFTSSTVYKLVKQRTTIERWMNEGYHKGLPEAVNLATKLKFPEQHQNIMSLVNKIEDNKKLERIINVFETFKQASELKKMVEQ